MRTSTDRAETPRPPPLSSSSVPTAASLAILRSRKAAGFRPPTLTWGRNSELCLFTAACLLPSLVAEPGQFSKVGEHILHVGNPHTPRTARNVAPRQESHFVIVRRGFQATPCPRPDRAVVEAQTLRVMFDEPRGPQRHLPGKRFQRGRHVVLSIDALSHVVQQRGQQELLIVRQLVARSAKTWRL